VISAGPRQPGLDRPRGVNARRDAIVMCVLITAVMLLVWNGSTFFRHMQFAGQGFGTQVRIASTAMT
jgi:hypothetical protein